MKKILLSAFILASIALHAQTEFELDFKNTDNGKLTKEALSKAANGIDWTYLNDNAMVVLDQDRGRVLQIKYPKGNVGPNTIGFSGSQFIKKLKPSNEYYLDYYLRFEEGFDFSKGGKLPGLTSGGSTYTGGHHPDNGEGWSARYMWVKDGKMVVYLYYMDMTDKYGESVHFNMNLVPGKWYRITQRVKLNEDNLKNGILQVWVDGKQVIDRQDLRLRLWGKGMIDTFYFSTFYGGATADWAPSKDTFIDFDKFRVTTEKPDFSK